MHMCCSMLCLSENWKFSGSAFGILNLNQIFFLSHRYVINRTILQQQQFVRLLVAGRAIRLKFVGVSFYSTAQWAVNNTNDEREREKATLAVDLASLVVESSIVEEIKPRSRMEVSNQTEVFPCDGHHGVQFLGTLIKRSLKEYPTIRAVHKLKEKVKLLASQEEDSWTAGTVKLE